MTSNLSAQNASCCFITCRFKKIAVVSLYRSPSTDISSGLHYLNLILSMLLLCTQHIIIAGDLNIDLLRDSALKNKYCDVLCDHHLTQLIDSPTRVTDYSATLIDNTLCTPDIPVCSVSQAVGLSDHRIQLVDFQASVQSPVSNYRWVQLFRHFDWRLVKADLKLIPWSDMEQFNNIEDAWTFFATVIDWFLDQYFPLKRVSCGPTKRHTPWMSDLRQHARDIYEI